MSIAASTEELDNLFGNTSKGQAMQLLGRGIAESQAATILGVTPGLISQYKEDAEFTNGVSLLREETALASSIRDAKIDELEDLALAQLAEVLPTMYNPGAILNAAKVLNGMHRRSAPQAFNPNEVHRHIIELDLPEHITHAAVQVQFNSNNEVVEVNGRAMRTMPAAEVGRRLELVQEKRKELESPVEANDQA